MQYVPIQWEDPSLYFHKILVDSTNHILNLFDRIENDSFIERLYTCLASWDMHRFDNSNAYLIDFPQLREQVYNLAHQLANLTDYRLHELNEETFQVVSNTITWLINDIHVVATKWLLVTNTKLIQHTLPHLVPPIDLKYTLIYFVNRTDDSNNPPSYSFEKPFRSFWIVAITNGQALAEICVGIWDLPNLWNTTVPKIIDNALVSVLQ